MDCCNLSYWHQPIRIYKQGPRRAYHHRNIKNNSRRIFKKGMAQTKVLTCTILLALLLCMCKFLCLIYSFVLLFYKGFFSTPKPVHDRLWYYSVRVPLNISLSAFLMYFTVLLTPNELLMHVMRQIAMKWAPRNAAETILTLENASQERMINLTPVSAGNFAAPNVREPNANCWAIVTNVIVCVDAHVQRLRVYL